MGEKFHRTQGDESAWGKVQQTGQGAAAQLLLTCYLRNLDTGKQPHHDLLSSPLHRRCRLHEPGFFRTEERTWDPHTQREPDGHLPLHFSS